MDLTGLRTPVAKGRFGGLFRDIRAIVDCDLAFGNPGITPLVDQTLRSGGVWKSMSSQQGKVLEATVTGGTAVNTVSVEQAGRATIAGPASKLSSNVKRAPVRARVPEETKESLSETNFSKAFKQIDTKASALIEEAKKASSHERRAIAQIVVEGVRLFEASEAASEEWDDLIKRELTDRGIKVNRGDNYPFRLIATLIFRGVTKIDDDADLADSAISRGQISRYGQAMAWAYGKYKSGLDLKVLADEIIKLGGMRKVADLWSKRLNAEETTSATEEEQPSGDEAENASTDVPSAASEPTDVQPSETEEANRPQAVVQSAKRGSPLPIMGVATLEQDVAIPVICVVYPGGKVFRAPLAPEAMATLVAQWEVGQ